MRIIKIVGDKKEEMTPEEIASWEQEAAQQPTPELTPEERISALEEELKAAKILLGLEE